MNKKHMNKQTETTDVPYNPENEKEALGFWKDAVSHTGVTELRVKRGRPKLAAGEKKEKIALRIDADVLAWYRGMGTGWQTRMNAVLKAYRDASE